MNKIKSTIILSLLLISTFTAFIPYAFASLGTINVTPVSVQAGGVVTLDFSAVTFSGTQFLLYWSTNGFSQINASDVIMTLTRLAVADVRAAGLQVVEIQVNNGLYGADTLWITIGNNLLSINIPSQNTAGGAHFVKAFDGNTASVAATNAITVLPLLSLTPTSGAGGQTVTLKGVALEASKLMNITYQNSPKPALVQITTDAIGFFQYSWSVKDLQTNWVGVGVPPSNPVDIYVFYNKTGASVGMVTYSEIARVLYQVKTLSGSYPAGGWGNATASTSAGILSSVIVAGNFFNPTDNVELYLGATLLTVAAVNGTGFFNATFTVPVVVLGSYTVKIINSGVVWTFTLTVTPSIILTPSEGPVGTIVQANGYGFPYLTTKPANVTITWYGYVNKVMGWVLTKTDGTFVFTFVVPRDYGGDHNVEAKANDSAVTTAIAIFTVTPTLVITPPETPNDGSLITVTGSGVDPSKWYVPNIDNQFLGTDQQSWAYPTDIYANATGDFTLKFVAAGFTPGLHVFSLYESGLLVPWYKTFTITGMTPDTEEIIDKLAETKAQIEAGLADLSSAVAGVNSLLTSSVADIRSDIAGVSSSVQVVGSNVIALSQVTSNGFSSMNSAMNSGFSGMNSAMNSGFSDMNSAMNQAFSQLSSSMNSGFSSMNSAMNSGFSGMNSAVNKGFSDMSSTLDTKINNVNSALGTLSNGVNSLGTSLSSQITTMSNTLGKAVSDNSNSIISTIQSEHDQLATDFKSSVGDISTFLMIIGILAAITLVIEAAILIRRLS